MASTSNEADRAREISAAASVRHSQSPRHPGPLDRQVSRDEIEKKFWPGWKKQIEQAAHAGKLDTVIDIWRDPVGSAERPKASLIQQGIKFLKENGFEATYDYFYSVCGGTEESPVGGWSQHSIKVSWVE